MSKERIIKERHLGISIKSGKTVETGGELKSILKKQK